MTAPNQNAASPAVTGVILAGGRARRMGGEDKGLIQAADRPLIEHVLERFRPQVEQLLISANRNLDRYRRYGYPVLVDTVEGFAGPLAGILTAMEATEQPWLAVVPCDSPMLPVDLVGRLLAAATAISADIAIARDGDRQHFTTALIRCALAPRMREYITEGGRRVESWYAAQPRTVLVDFSHAPEAFANVNRPGDLAALEAAILAKSPLTPGN